MATFTPPSAKKKDTTPKYPSSYGSHKSMVNDAETAKFRGNPENVGVLSDQIPMEKQVVLEDATGFYVTTSDRLDDGLADINRYTSANARKPWPKVEPKSKTQEKKDAESEKK